MRVRAFLYFLFVYATLSGAASAHPLGNFTINHLARVTASRGELHVRYVLDIAEIPTFQIMHERPGDGWNYAIMQSWARAEISTVQPGFHLQINGARAVMTPTHARASLRPGAGGLPILRWVGEFIAPLSTTGSSKISIDDQVYGDRRIGWKDIVVGGQAEPTNELRHYPSALIGSPRRINGATFTVFPPARIAGIYERTDATPVVGTLASWISPTVLSGMFTRGNQTPLFVLLTMLAAFGLGALHAVEPGHGKALLAFTLVGARATGKQALILAGSLTFAHTIGVMLLGAVLFFAAGFVSESIYPWITLISGIIIAVIGARTLARFVRIRRGIEHVHAHEHSGAHPHEHPHEHSQVHDQAQGHEHSHAIPGSQPLNFSSAVWAALSGGIAPCPAAIVVLLAALRLHHLAYGMVLIVIFSFGLAAVLSALGLGVVHGAAWLSRRSAYAAIAPYGPLLSASVISIIGAWMVAQGFSQQGVAAPVLLIAAITLLAIVGYALTQHGHTHSPTVQEAKAT
jgi:nickel/cobalt exporter